MEHNQLERRWGLIVWLSHNRKVRLRGEHNGLDVSVLVDRCASELGIICVKVENDGCGPGIGIDGGVKLLPTLPVRNCRGWGTTGRAYLPQADAWGGHLKEAQHEAEQQGPIGRV